MTRGKATRSVSQTRSQSGSDAVRAKDGPKVGIGTCGAATRSGGKCRRPAGWGTDHVGAGRCKLHTGSTRNGRTSAAREQAAAEAAKLGVAIETDPFEALEAVVAILSGQVSYLQGKVADLEDGLDGDALHPILRALNDVLDRLRQAAKAAADAGVAKRRADLDEFVLIGLSEAMRRTVADVGLPPDVEDALLSGLAHHLQALDDLDDWKAPPALGGGS